MTDSLDPDRPTDGGLSRRVFLRNAGLTVAGTLTAGLFPNVAESMGQKQEMKTDDQLPRLFAHRGFAGLYPENTTGAVYQATRGFPDPESKRIRAEMVEIDVMPSADGDVMVFHDNTLGDLTDIPEANKDRLFWDTSTEKLRRLRVLNTDEKIPFLDEIFESLPTEVGVNIELKNPGSKTIKFAEVLNDSTRLAQTDVWMDFTEKTLSIATDYTNEILVSSFYESALAAVREVNPEIPIAFLFWDSIQEGIEITRRYDCEALHPPRNMMHGTSMFQNDYYDGQSPKTFESVDLIQWAHDREKSVNVWTVKTWQQASKLAESGVDGIISDYPGVYRYEAVS